MADGQTHRAAGGLLRAETGTSLASRVASRHAGLCFTVGLLPVLALSVTGLAAEMAGDLRVSTDDPSLTRLEASQALLPPHLRGGDDDEPDLPVRLQVYFFPHDDALAGNVSVAFLRFVQQMETQLTRIAAGQGLVAPQAGSPAPCVLHASSVFASESDAFREALRVGNNTMLAALAPASPLLRYVASGPRGASDALRYSFSRDTDGIRWEASVAEAASPHGNDTYNKQECGERAKDFVKKAAGDLLSWFPPGGQSNPWRLRRSGITPYAGGVTVAYGGPGAADLWVADVQLAAELTPTAFVSVFAHLVLVLLTWAVTGSLFTGAMACLHVLLSVGGSRGLLYIVSGGVGRSPHAFSYLSTFQVFLSVPFAVLAVTSLHRAFSVGVEDGARRRRGDSRPLPQRLRRASLATRSLAAHAAAAAAFACVARGHPSGYVAAFARLAAWQVLLSAVMLVLMHPPALALYHRMLQLRRRAGAGGSAGAKTAPAAAAGVTGASAATPPPPPAGGNRPVRRRPPVVTPPGFAERIRQRPEELPCVVDAPAAGAAGGFCGCFGGAAAAPPTASLPGGIGVGVGSASYDTEEGAIDRPAAQPQHAGSTRSRLLGSAGGTREAPETLRIPRSLTVLAEGVGNSANQRGMKIEQLYAQATMRRRRSSYKLLRAGAQPEEGGNALAQQQWKLVADAAGIESWGGDGGSGDGDAAAEERRRRTAYMLYDIHSPDSVFFNPRQTRRWTSTGAVASPSHGQQRRRQRPRLGDEQSDEEAELRVVRWHRKLSARFLAFVFTPWVVSWRLAVLAAFAAAAVGCISAAAAAGGGGGGTCDALRPPLFSALPTEVAVSALLTAPADSAAEVFADFEPQFAYHRGDLARGYAGHEVACGLHAAGPASGFSLQAGRAARCGRVAVHHFFYSGDGDGVADMVDATAAACSDMVRRWGGNTSESAAFFVDAALRDPCVLARAAKLRGVDSAAGLVALAASLGRSEEVAEDAAWLKVVPLAATPCSGADEEAAAAGAVQDAWKSAGFAAGFASSDRFAAVAHRDDVRAVVSRVGAWLWCGLVVACAVAFSSARMAAIAACVAASLFCWVSLAGVVPGGFASGPLEMVGTGYFFLYVWEALLLVLNAYSSHLTSKFAVLLARPTTRGAALLRALEATFKPAVLPLVLVLATLPAVSTVALKKHRRLCGLSFGLVVVTGPQLFVLLPALLAAAGPVELSRLPPSFLLAAKLLAGAAAVVAIVLL